MVKEKAVFLGALLTIALLISSIAYAGNGATRVAGAIWADGELFDTVLTPATFIAPPEHSTDAIYSFMMSGLTGQRSVAASSPGDPEFNGGRWDVQIVTFTTQGTQIFDANSDGIVDYELTSEEEVLAHEAQGNLIINEANFYFECPLLPRRK